MFLYKRIRIAKRRKARSRKSQKDYLEQKKRATALVFGRLDYFNNHYNLQYQRVFIRNQITKWGTCSTLGNLSFNYRIVYLPSHLADYLIVHELCHLKYLNHSKEFWDLVAQTIPDYKFKKCELRKVRLA